MVAHDHNFRTLKVSSAQPDAPVPPELHNELVANLAFVKPSINNNRKATIIQ